jgi:Tannase and feruloyl esterase
MLKAAVVTVALGSGVMWLALHSTVVLAQNPGCERVAQTVLPNTKITLAQMVAAGAFRPPATPTVAGVPGESPFAALPAFCRVAATLTPSSDSDIKIEVWMPIAGWNGKFQGVGNGGWNGAIRYGALAEGLGRGYATAATDTGHSGASAAFALGHPEKIVDFGYRAVHEMTAQGKAIVRAYYQRAPQWSYWVGCSSGGKQGLKEAQRFPNDYDGIVAGAPANYWTHLMAGSLWVAHATLKDSASYIPPAKYGVIHAAVLTECDLHDGVKDGVVENPEQCRFDPAILQCGGTDASDCLTASQVEAARKIYGPARNPLTGAVIFPGLAPGSEPGWAAMAGGPNPLSIPNEHFKYVVFKDPNWDFKTLKFDSHVELADRIDDGLLNATDPNLNPFVSHGGKLILYHGWNDQLIAPQNTINYYRAVTDTLGSHAKTAQSIRLFMAPGMAHCAGGDGPNTFNMLGALEQWVEHGRAPDRVAASLMSEGKAVRIRPLCPYPQVAHYKGAGSTDVAANFVCRAP